MDPNKPNNLADNTDSASPQTDSPITPEQPTPQMPVQPEATPSGPVVVPPPAPPSSVQSPQQPVMSSQAPGVAVEGNQQAASPAFSTPTPPGGVVPSQKKKIPKWAIVAVGVAIIAVVAAALFGPKLLGGGIALTTYKGDGYSALVPKAYTKEAQSDGVMFNEDDEIESRSLVYVNGEQFETELSESERDQLVTYLEGGFDTLLEQNISTSGSITNKNVDKTQYKGMEARRITATYEKDGREVGKIHALFVIDTKGIYALMVVASETDQDLQKSANKIIDSLEVEG